MKRTGIKKLELKRVTVQQLTKVSGAGFYHSCNGGPCSCGAVDGDTDEGFSGAVDAACWVAEASDCCCGGSCGGGY